MYMDFRELFSENYLRLYGFNQGWNTFINTFDMSEIIEKVDPSDIGRNHDHRVTHNKFFTTLLIIWV